MAAATYSVTTISQVNTIWRVVQAPLQHAAQFMVPEYDGLEEIPELNIDWSGRQILVPLDLQDDFGVASIPEGGFEARPSSPKPAEATVSWILLNARITISKTARWIGTKDRAAMLENQLLYQGTKKLQAVARRIGEYMYGFSTAVVAKVASYANPVVTLKDAYGIAGLGSTTAPFRVTNPFKVGDAVAILNPTGPALRGTPQVLTAVTPATPSITLTADVTGTTGNDLVVFANSLENTTLAGGTDYNAGLTGFLDAATSTTLHNVSSSTEPKWAAGSDTTGGRLTGARLIKARQFIEDNGGGTLTRVRYDRGVERDFIAYLQAAVRFANPYAMVVDGRPKMEGVTFESTRFVPDGYAFAYDDKRSMKKMTLLPKPGQLAWDDLKEKIDESGFIGTLDYPCATPWVSRGNLFYFSGLTAA